MTLVLDFIQSMILMQLFNEYYILNTMDRYSHKHLTKITKDGHVLHPKILIGIHI